MSACPATVRPRCGRNCTRNATLPSLLLLVLLMFCGWPGATHAACTATDTESHGTCIDNETDWQARRRAAGVFYANNFDYADRDAYLAGAHSYRYAATDDGKPKLDLETKIRLSGRGASRHNWFVSEGANELGPAWAYSFDGPGLHTTNALRQRFYMQYAMYADPTWARFVYQNGAIKNHILLNPGRSLFAHGEVVLVRSGRGPWVHGFSVSDSARGWFLKWDAPRFVAGDDTIYTFWDADPRVAPSADINSFERRFGPRRRHFDAEDKDYAAVPHLAGGHWYVIETYVDLSPGNSIIKVWFAERGKPPILLTGTPEAGMHETADTYRGGFLINRAEDARTWVDNDTFVVYDELLVSEQPIAFPGDHTLPTPGRELPANWPPADAEMR